MSHSLRLGIGISCSDDAKQRIWWQGCRFVEWSAVCDHRGIHLRVNGRSDTGVSGQKIEGKEIKLACIALLIHPVIILVPTALALMRPEAVASISNGGTHGLTEVLYAFASGLRIMVRLLPD